MVTGVRGLCTGLGPAIFGLIFYIFNVDVEGNNDIVVDPSKEPVVDSRILPGPPFLFGGCSVILAMIILALTPKTVPTKVKTDIETSDEDPMENNKLLAAQNI